jgi:DNA modification methylase
MFPEQFVAQQLRSYTQPNDVVFDPFCGRGTTVFESLLQGRVAAGLDINPVAACIAGAKAAPPDLEVVLTRLGEIEERYQTASPEYDSSDEFFQACFHPDTLSQLLFLRDQLSWQDSIVDRFIAAVVLGCLHGESQKSPNYLSNQMPRTISPKPDYSVRWWASRGLCAPRREVFQIVSGLIHYRLAKPPAVAKGKVVLRDAREANLAFPELRRSVDLVVTSPPYLDTTDFREDQWLRLWFLGGPTRPTRVERSDDRYRSEEPYWKFLVEAWRGCADLMKVGTVIVIRIGGMRLSRQRLTTKVVESLCSGLEGYEVVSLHEGVETEIVNRQTNAFRPGAISKRFEYDFAFELG